MPTIWVTDSGYQWAGLAAQVGLEKEFTLGKSWCLSFEGKLTNAEADITIAEGCVRVSNTAIHLLGGIKYSF